MKSKKTVENIHEVPQKLFNQIKGNFFKEKFNELYNEMKEYAEYIKSAPKGSIDSMAFNASFIAIWKIQDLFHVKD